jgi:hypothetical protein
MAFYSGDEVVEKSSAFIDIFFEGFPELLDYGKKAIDGLQRLLDSINSKVEGKKADEGIEGLKENLREVLSEAEEYRNACLKAARRGSCRQEIDGINEALKQGDLAPLFHLVNDMLQLFSTCSQCLQSFEYKCNSTRQKLRSAVDKYETRKKSATIGGIVAGGAAGVGVVGGLAALVGGAILTPFFPPAGLLIAGAGGAAVAVTAIVVREIANDALEEVESLGNHLESVKRRVDSIYTTMEECKDKIEATNRSGERAQGKTRVSHAVCRKIQMSLDSMCTKFENLILRL